jgi:hypothetical protein
MRFVRFMRSFRGRALRVAVGLWLVAYGATHPSLLGLVLMMVGMVPAVTGLAGICLIEEVIKSRRTSHLPAGRPREHHA